MKLAAVFPGQGSQSPGMLADLAAEYPVIVETFSEASEVLGYDAWDLAQNGTEEKLRQTEITQPLMFVSGIAVWRLWQQLNLPQPLVMAGHSLGEYTALTASGSLSFDKALPLVATRGRLMAGAVAAGIGGMAALLGMDDEAAIELCESLTSPTAIVEAVNFNSPGQVVISGHLPALENACLVAREKGARKAMVLPVSVPNHSTLMQPAQAELAAAIDQAGLSYPHLPVLQNASAAVAADVAELSESLRQHVVNPVQWTNTVQAMKHRKIDVIVELGPGKVLAGLCKRIERSIPALPIDSSASLEKAVNTLAEKSTDA